MDAQLRRTSEEGSNDEPKRVFGVRPNSPKADEVLLDCLCNSAFQVWLLGNLHPKLFSAQQASKG